MEYAGARARFRPAAITIHPDYVARHRRQSDIALLELEREIGFSKRVQPICLPGDHLLRTQRSTQ